VDGTTPFQLWTVVPSWEDGGCALLGEAHKYVAVSPQRFAGVSYLGRGMGVGVDLTGGPGEPVDLLYIAGGVVKAAHITLDATGRASATLA
jgi:hypothetical protein